MRRWHEERGLMLRRWHEEIAQHENVVWAPLPRDPAPDPSGALCHCYRGPGFMRKHTPGCNRPRCGLCHRAKLYDRGRRPRERSEAFAQEWAATGGW